MNWDHFLTHLNNNLNDCIKKWAHKMKKPKISFRDWKENFIKAIMDRIEVIKKKKRFYKKMSFSKKEILLKIKKIHDKYVFVPTDKAGNKATCLVELQPSLRGGNVKICDVLLVWVYPLLRATLRLAQL